ncbi:MAG: hypothetical protein ACKVVP_05140 [Chloroflexota bacterium]
MFKRVGRLLRRIDGWFFRLTDRQRVGVVLGTALFLFSSALYCLGIGSVILLQRPYEVAAEVVYEPGEVVIVELEPTLQISTPTSLPTPTRPSGSLPPTPIAAVEIAEPPAQPRPSISEPPARPRVVGPDVKPEAPSQRLPTAVPTSPPVIRQPTAAPKPGQVLTPGTPVTAQTTPLATLPAGPTTTGVSKQPTLAPTSGSQPTAAAKLPTPLPTAVPKPAPPTAASKAPTAATSTPR